jgi:hypothetical protein
MTDGEPITYDVPGISGERCRAARRGALGDGDDGAH